MKLMVVNNTVMFEKGDGLFVYKETGKFFEDLYLKGNDVTVFQFSMEPQGSDFMATFDLINRGMNILNIRRRGSKYKAYLKAFWKGFKAIGKEDFVYLFYPGHFCTVLAFFCLLRRKPFGLYIRGEKGIFGFIQKYLYKRAQVIFTISPRFTDLVRRAGGKAETIRPMMGFSEADILENRSYSKKEHFQFLFVGRIERDKGVFELLQALESLIKHGVENFTMHFAGDGIHMSNVVSMIQEKKIQKYFVFHGTISDKSELREIYKNSDLFIFPSHHEGFPRVIYEAMIFGVPIITTFVGTISYLMQDNRNCYKVEPGDWHDLGNKIVKFMENYPDSARVAMRGTETIKEYLSNKQYSHSEQLVRHLKSISNV